MKLSKDTINVIKGFSNINSNLLIKEGSTLSTISVSKSQVAVAEVEDEFPQDFGIYDVKEFLGVVELFEDPELTFDDKHVVIKQGKNSIKYFAADPTVLDYPKKFPKFNDPEYTFKLDANTINSVLKTASVLKTNNISFVGNGETLTVIVGDRKNSTSNKFELELGETDKTFSINIVTDNLKIIPDSYDVEIIDRRMARLISGKMEYVVALEADSTYA